MKLKVGDWFTVGMNLSPLLTKDLPVKVAFRLGRLVKNLNPLVQDVEKSRMDLVKKHGKPDDNGETMSVPKENIEAFKKEWEEICAVEEEIIFQPLRVEDLGNIDVSAQLLLSLEKIFEPETETPKAEEKEAAAVA